MESHEDKEARRTAGEIFHIGHNIVGARVANLEFPLPQSVADIKRARCIGYVDIETMPRKYSLLPAGVHRKIVAGPELDQSKSCKTGRGNLLGISYPPRNAFVHRYAGPCHIRQDLSRHSAPLTLLGPNPNEHLTGNLTSIRPFKPFKLFLDL